MYQVYSDELYHHGISGQKWGVRRFQNEDGSLTPAGQERYNSLSRGQKRQYNRIERVVKKQVKRINKLEARAQNLTGSARENIRNEINALKRSTLASKNVQNSDQQLKTLATRRAVAPLVGVGVGVGLSTIVNWNRPFSAESVGRAVGLITASTIMSMKNGGDLSLTEDGQKTVEKYSKMPMTAVNKQYDAIAKKINQT